MAILVQPSELKAGHTFYVITSEDTIEAYYVIRKRGKNRYAMTVEGQPLAPDLMARILYSCSKFRTRGAARRMARLNNIKINN